LAAGFDPRQLPQKIKQTWLTYMALISVARALVPALVEPGDEEDGWSHRAVELLIDCHGPSTAASILRWPPVGMTVWEGQHKSAGLRRRPLHKQENAKNDGMRASATGKSAERREGRGEDGGIKPPVQMLATVGKAHWKDCALRDQR